MRSIAGVWITLALAGITGCATPLTSREADPARQGQTLRLRGTGSAVLLFDRRPSEAFSPEEFARRSGWLVTERGILAGEVIQYQELLIDRERDFPFFNDRVYRRFTSRRSGLVLR